MQVMWLPVGCNISFLTTTWYMCVLILQVTDWWEEYVYLRGRSPLIVNSNYYIMVWKTYHLFAIWNIQSDMVQSSFGTDWV